jgi:hypothetical protein
MPDPAPPNFAQDVLDRIAAYRVAAGKEPLRPGLASYYGVLVMTTGERTTAADVHNAAWAMHAAEHRPGHPDLLPWGQLDPANAQRDEPHAEMVRVIAADMKRDGAGL